MDQLTKFLVNELVDGKSVTAVYGGGFKPPTKGHFDLVKTALKDFKDIDKFLIYVGGGVRDGIEQEQSMQIWEIYKELLPSKVEIIPSASPIGDVKRYAKNHPDEKVYFIIGYREGREDDLQDIADRTKGVEEKYPNLEVRVIKTPAGDMSGTNARKALQKGDKAKFFTYLPTEVPANEKEDIYQILEPTVVKEHLTENTIPSIDILEKIAELTNYMREKGYNIDPVPSITIVDDDVENAGEFLGKTAYYDPTNKSITLYTYGRHPKDIVRSYAHEMIHHIQNLENRLGDITTTNTQEDDNLNDIEAEANLKGTMTFRNWTDSLQEGKQINYTNPNFNTEWEEAIRYPEFKEMGKNGWLKISNQGKPVSYSSIKDKLGNVDLDFEGLEEPKKQRFLDAFKKGTIEMPIAVKFSDSDYDLVAGNTRLSGLVKNRIDSKIWIVDISNIQEKKNKDPFGLNQYARELAQGLEEKQLNEGRYDKFTNELSRLAFGLIKDGYDVGRKVVDETFTVGPADEEPDIVSDDFEFDFVVQVTYTDDIYTVDGGANAGYDDEGDEITPLLTVRFEIPKDIDWQRVSFDLKDVIRHELEHLTQDGANVRSGKQLPDDSMLRKIIDAELLPKASYFKLKKEVDAMLQGLYLKAKKSKQPLLSVIDDYLDKQPLSQEERKEILDLWAKRAKALGLPSFTSASVKETSYLHDTGVEKKDEEMRREMGGKKPVIFCDMDGVLVDFDEGYKQVTGVTTHHADSQGKDEFWKLFRDGLKDKDISERSYWANLDWMPDGKQLWDYIKEYNPYVLTAPSVNFDIPFEERYKMDNNESMQGKTEWVQRLPNMKKIYFRSAKRKADFAGPNKILIDDRKDTIDSWNANGGIGILHTSAANTIKQLETILKTRSELNEIFEKDLPYVDKVSKNTYKVGNGKDIEAQYYFKLEIPERNVWSLNWSFTPNNTNQTPESWKQVTATSFKVLEDWLKNNNPKSIHISGNTSSKTKLYKNYIDKLQILLNNRYRIDNSDEDKIVLRSIEEATQSNIKKRMETLNESYSQSLDYFQNGDLHSVSKIERWESFKKKIQRTLLKELYKL